MEEAGDAGEGVQQQGGEGEGGVEEKLQLGFFGFQGFLRICARA